MGNVKNDTPFGARMAVLNAVTFSNHPRLKKNQGTHFPIIPTITPKLGPSKGSGSSLVTF